MIDYRACAAQINQAIADIAALQKMRKEVDPASCMAISVRRGVPHDNADVEDDFDRRPWRTFSFGNAADDKGGLGGMHRLLDILIADRAQHLKFWMRVGTDDMQALIRAEAAAQTVLNSLGTAP